jgi:hypothetical protein
MSELAPHQQRVVDERAQLDIKTWALKAFIEGSPTFRSLPEVERMRLYAQHRVMAAYLMILDERIAAFV